MNQRFFGLFLFFLVWFGAIGARLYYWQGIKAADLKEAARAQYERSTTQEAFRGKIISSDKKSLALSVETFRLIARPNLLTSPPSSVARLIEPLIYSPSPQAATDSTKRREEERALELTLIGRLSDPKRKWVVLESGLSSKQKEELQAIDPTVLTFEPMQSRFYPEGTLLSHVLGFVGNTDAGESKGFFGLEGFYDLELRGNRSKLTQISDAVGQPISIELPQAKPQVMSRDIQLTIHRDIQHTVEEHLKAGVERYGAKSADAIVMDPLTGKVLAMASYPSYDPASYSDADPLLFKNPTVADGYEPGSTFKVLTVATGIDLGLISPQTQCDRCGGPVTIGKYTIKTWNNEYHPNTTILDGLKHSDNTAMVYIAQKVGEERFLSYLKNFGIGQKSGIDLQDEGTPKLRPDKEWGEIDLATASFGQGIALTMVQMLNAVNVIANGGSLYKPFVVEEVSSGEEHFVTQPTKLRNVITPETARTVANMMREAASQGDARWTLPKEYPIAGKTGTAQIPVAGHYDENRTIASFVGFSPVENPKFSMLVRVVEPTSSPWGSETAAPLWFEIARDLFVKFGVGKMEQPTNQ